MTILELLRLLSGVTVSSTSGQVAMKWLLQEWVTVCLQTDKLFQYTVSEWRPARHSKGHFGDDLYGQNAHKHKHGS